MKTKELNHFLERGYLRFPYIIIRKFPAAYIQVPMHRSELKKYFTEGIFIDQTFEEVLGYEEACNVHFELYYQEETNANGPFDMCLVLDDCKARFIGKNESEIDKNGQYMYGPIPCGGILFSCKGEIMRINKKHYIDF